MELADLASLRRMFDGPGLHGQFYAAIEARIRRLCDELGEEAVFSGDPAKQNL